MLDEILDLFSRKRKASGAKPGGLGGILTRVQDSLEGDDDHHRSTRDDRRYRNGDGRSLGHDPYDDDHDDDRGRGRRRERDGFDFGDD